MNVMAKSNMHEGLTVTFFHCRPGINIKKVSRSSHGCCPVKGCGCGFPIETARWETNTPWAVVQNVKDWPPSGMRPAPCQVYFEVCIDPLYPYDNAAPNMPEIATGTERGGWEIDQYRTPRNRQGDEKYSMSKFDLYFFTACLLVAAAWLAAAAYVAWRF